jgi:hypothetical protein
MSSESQIAANRRNAKRSTGPKTEEGKTASRLNAITHGLTAAAPLLPTESEDEYAAFRNAMLDGLVPDGPLETQLAEEVVDLSWRLRRATKLEHGVLARGVASADERFYSARKRMFEVTESDVANAQLAAAVGLENKVIEITNPELHECLESLLDEAVCTHRTDEARLAEAFVEDAAGPNAMSKLDRHETSLFHRRTRALDALRTAQETRPENYRKEDK